MEPFRTFLAESTLASLYDSAVAAFPHTRKRQHAVDPVKIEALQWTPFLGLKTLLVRGRAVNEGRQYKTLILFKGVEYLAEGGVPLEVGDGRDYRVRPLSYGESEVLLRCDCPDFNWRFNYYNHLDSSLYGRKRRKYEGKGGEPANPREMPGQCKHLMKLSTALRDAGILVL